MVKTILTAAAIAVLTPVLLLVRVWDDLCIRYDVKDMDRD